MPGTDLLGAMEVAERIRRSVVSLNVPHIGSPAGYVTVSIGCAVMCPSVGDTELSLLAMADKALYDAKNAGRNRVHIPPGSDAGERIMSVHETLSPFATVPDEHNQSL